MASLEIINTVKKDENLILFTRKEVMDLLKVSKTTLWRLQNNGNLQCVKIGSKVLFKKETIEVFIKGMDPLLTRDEVMQILRISPKKLCHLQNKGELKPLRIGAKVLFTKQEIENFINGKLQTDK